MTRLQQLVERYVSGQLQFPEFRRAFVMDFLAVADQDPANWAAVLQLESDCDDFARGLITEDQLKLNLAAKKYPPSSVVLCPAPEPFVVSDVPFRGMWPAIVTGSASTVPAPEMGTAVGRLAGVTLAWEYV